ncbi:MAG: NAD(P)/FAD-dependent oxidoreductase [Actinomycetota bacterium]
MTDQPELNDTDLDAVREKYRVERDKRLEGSSRAVVVPDFTGPGAEYLVDPYQPVVEREPVNDEVDVVIVGAGFGGLLFGANLRDEGMQRIRLIDTAGDVGGVWYWNRYPGAMCDVESLIYMPLLEELGYVPKDRYAKAAEILAHAKKLAKHYGLYDDALFHTAVTELRWDDEEGHWLVTTNRGDQIRALHVLVAPGPLNRLRLPDLPGLDSFKGRVFHTSRWDYSYTGGDSESELTGLRDKAVGIVGTGATGLQCVPQVAKYAKQLYVFQRTPSTVAVRDNRPIDPEWVKSQQPGWQARRQDNFTDVLAGVPVDEDLVHDSWTDLYNHLLYDPAFAELSPDAAAKLREIADFNQMESVRSRIATEVADPQTAEALKPYYAYTCKRPGFHDEYLASFNRPNVTLVDTQGQGLEAAYRDGVIVNGEKYELDCLILATGFSTETAGRGMLGYEVVGRDGLTLNEKWAGGLSTLHGIATSRFPNFFLMPGNYSQSAGTVNLMHAMQHHAKQVAYIIGEATRRGARVVEVDPEAEAAWVQTILDKAPDRKEFLAACTPGRDNYEGANTRPAQNALYGGTPREYFEILEKWRQAGDLAGFRLS